jgi:hypothetical protein
MNLDSRVESSCAYRCESFVHTQATHIIDVQGYQSSTVVRRTEYDIQHLIMPLMLGHCPRCETFSVCQRPDVSVRIDQRLRDLRMATPRSEVEACETHVVGQMDIGAML